MDKQRLRRGCFYELRVRNERYLAEFKGREVYYRYSERRVRYIFDVTACEPSYKTKELPDTITMPPDYVHERVIKKVPRDDLPTYVGWPLISPKFSEILSNKNRLRIKLRRKRLNKRMLYAKN